MQMEVNLIWFYKFKNVVKNNFTKPPVVTSTPNPQCVPSHLNYWEGLKVTKIIPTFPHNNKLLQIWVLTYLQYTPTGETKTLTEIIIYKNSTKMATSSFCSFQFKLLIR